MNLNNIRKEPAFVAAAGGFLGLVLRFWLYCTGFDDKGILSASHPLHLACVALTAVVILYLALKARKLPENPQDRPLLRLIPGLAAGLFLLFHGLELFRRVDAPLTLIHCSLTVAAGIAMAVCGLSGAKRGAVLAACHGMVCVSFAADMLGRYRDWSGNPQLPDYCFHVLAGVALSLCAYHTLALHTGLGKPRIHRFWCLSALFLSVLCLAGPEPRAFYLSGACWAFCCLLTRLPQEAEAAPEENDDVSA